MTLRTSILSLIAVAGVALASVAGFRLLGLGLLVTDGASMEPGISEGDLAVTRPAAEYHHGDVVAYRSEEIDRMVLHRVVDRNGERFVTKGDNNSWLDPDMPTEAEIQGELWLRVPRGGAALGWLRSPMGAALATGVAGAVVLFTRQRKGEARAPKPSRTRRPLAASPELARGVTTVAQVAAGVVVASLALAAVAYTRPLEATSTVPAPVTHVAELTYSAPADPTVYETGEVTTGETVFLRVVPQIDVRLSYSFDSSFDPDRRAATGVVEGTLGLDLEIRGASGWIRTQQLVDEQPFAGDEGGVTARLDLPSIQRTAAEVQTAIGVVDPYTVAVVGRVGLRSRVDGTIVEETFDPEVGFRLDSTAFVPVEKESMAPGEPILVSQPSQATVFHSQATRLELGKLGRATSTARLLAVATAAGAAAVGLAALAVLLLPARARRRLELEQTAPAALPAGALRVASLELPPNPTTVDTGTLDALADVAARHSLPLLMKEQLHERIFVVVVQATVFYYRERTATRGAAPVDNTDNTDRMAPPPQPASAAFGQFVHQR